MNENDIVVVIGGSSGLGDHIASPEVKQARLAGMAAQLPGGRIGHPEDIANAVSYLMSDNLVTGTVLHAEGAQLLV